MHRGSPPVHPYRGCATLPAHFEGFEIPLLARSGALALITAAAGFGGSSGGGGSGGDDCTKVPVADATTGGCNIRLAQPIACHKILK
jgi:hypothetical protein